MNEEKVFTLVKQISVQKRQIEELKQQIETYSSENTSLKTQLKEITLQLKKQQILSAKKQKDIQSLELSQSLQLQKSLNLEEVDKLQTIDCKIEEQSKLIRNLTSNNLNLDEFHHKEQLIRDLTNDNKQLSNQISNYQKEVSQLNDKISNQNDTLQLSLKTNQGLEQQISQYITNENEVKNLQHQNTQQLAILQDKDAQIFDLQNMMVQLQQDKCSASQQLMVMQKQVQKLEDDHANTSQQSIIQSKTINNQQSFIEELNQQLKNFNKETDDIQSLKTQTQKLEKENQQLQQTNLDYTQLVEQNKIQEQENAVYQLVKTQYQRSQVQITNFKQQVQSLQTFIQESTDCLLLVVEEISALKNIISQIFKEIKQNQNLVLDIKSIISLFQSITNREQNRELTEISIQDLKYNILQRAGAVINQENKCQIDCLQTKFVKLVEKLRYNGDPNDNIQKLLLVLKQFECI